MHKSDWVGDLNSATLLSVSLSVDTFASWRAWPGEDFVQGIVVATGKLSTRSRRIPCKRLGERVSVKDDRSTRTVNINMPHHAIHGVPVTTAITAGGVATGPSTPTSAKSGASKLPTPTKVPSSYSSPRYHRM